MPELYAYQEEVMKEALRFYPGGVGLWLDPGLGKTATTLRMIQKIQPKRVLVVAPVSVLGVWEKEARIWAPERKVQVLTGKVNERIYTVATTDADILVVNYDVLAKMEVSFCKWNPQVVIADESHRAKGHATKASKALAKIGSFASFRIALSGTPLPNGPVDAFGQYRFLDPKIFGPYITKFREKYCVTNPKIPQQILRYKNLNLFEQKFHSQAIVRKKKDVLNLPDTINTTIPVPLPAKFRKQYEQLENDLVVEIEEVGTITAPSVLTLLLRLAQLTGGTLTDTIVHRAKLDALQDWLEDRMLNPEQKVVIFARFTPEIDAITALCKSYGVRIIDGRTPMKDRPQIVEEFQTKQNVRVIVAQTRAAGLGITLTAADTAIFYSLDYSEADHQQAKDRVHRVGQTKTCEYVYFIAENTIDNAIARALQEKRNLTEAIINRRRLTFNSKHICNLEHHDEHHEKIEVIRHD